METRKVIIVNNKTQSQKVINSSALTLGELKAEARAAGINIEGMTWYEGHMRAELKDDSAPLPAVVTWKGQETRELTFLLTQPEKKVKSGAMTRPEAYAKVKELGLQNVCKQRFGKNFTQVPTADLVLLIESASNCACAPAEAKPVEAKPCECAKAEVPAKGKADVVEAIKVLAEALYDADCIDGEMYDQVVGLLEGETVQSEKMSKRDIDEMFNFVDR